MQQWHPEAEQDTRKRDERMDEETGPMDRRLKERTLNEAFKKSPRRKIVRLIFESSVGLREPGNGTLWKCRPPPKRKR
jgi:hypothetical protein